MSDARDLVSPLSSQKLSEFLFDAVDFDGQSWLEIHEIRNLK